MLTELLLARFFFLYIEFVFFLVSIVVAAISFGMYLYRNICMTS